jgi:glycosyltransferase involved in cell wall biosynthesis/bacterioferritin (cytochrome b1)
MFRAGSTYLFNKFRVNDCFECFYEPLHQDLIKLRKNNIDTFWGFDPSSEVTKKQNHPSLQQAHFKEYQKRFKNDKEIFPFFEKSYSFDEYDNIKSENFKKYIDTLVNVEKQKTPVLQFNRTTLRIDWFKDNYKNSVNVYLLRNPREQFESYLKRSGYIFEVMNLLIIKNCKIFSTLMDKFNIPTYENDNFDKEYNYYAKVTKNLSIVQKYEIFYAIWTESLKHALKYADKIIVMEKISQNEQYKNKVKNTFKQDFDIDIDFEDFSMSTYSKYSSSLNEYQQVEQNLSESNKSQVQEYLEFYNLGEYMTKSASTITIVTPSYNQGEFIEETINSVISQKGDFFIDYVIMDGGSTDGTIDIIKKCQKNIEENSELIKQGGLSYHKNKSVGCAGISYRFFSEKDKGQADAINKGFKLAKGEVLCWLNSDDFYYSENSIQTVMNHFETQKDSYFVYARGGRTNRKGKWIEEEKYVTNYKIEDLNEVDFILQPSSFWKKEVYEKVGDLDINMHYAFDWEYWLRVKKYFKINFLDELIAMNRVYGETKTSIGGEERAEEIYKLLLDYNGATPRAIRVYKIPQKIVQKYDKNLEVQPLDELKQSFDLLCSYSILRNPIGKYKAYKKLMQCWNKNKYRI